MANILGLYDPYFYANEAIAALKKRLGMALAVHRGYDRSPQEKGSIIEIRKPSVFTAQDMPGTPQDLDPGKVSITLDKWKGVSMKLTDKDLTLSKDEIITEHVGPMTYALADAVDLSLWNLHTDVPWFYDLSNDGAVTDFTGMRSIMFDNLVPDDGMRSFMMDGVQEGRYGSNTVFVNANTSSDGATTQRTGGLGVKYGFNLFASQNVQSHTGGTLSTPTLAAVGAYAGGVQSTPINTMNLDAVAVTGTVKRGDTFVIAGNTQRYAITADATAAGNAITVSFVPALVAAVADNAVVTVRTSSKVENLAFHKSAFALAMAPLSDLAGQLGAKVATVTDPDTGLTIRSRVWYNGNDAEVRVGVDALWGVKTLDPNRAVRANR